MTTLLGFASFLHRQKRKRHTHACSFTSPTLFNHEKICSSAYSEDQRCQIVFHTEAIGGNSEEIARTSGSCHGDLTHGHGALALAYAKMM